MSTISGLGSLNPLTALQQSDSPGNVSKTDPKSQLGQDQFLTLLVTQLKNQDPLQPLNNTDFIAQLATFSSLEKLTSIDSTLKKFAAGANSSSAASQGLLGTGTKKA